MQLNITSVSELVVCDVTDELNELNIRTINIKLMKYCKVLLRKFILKLLKQQ